MDEKQRAILRKSRSIFTRDLVDLDTVCDRLYQKEILSEGMKNDILSEKSRENQVRKLMDIIPKRGRKAFRAFFDVLEETFQHNLSDILCPDALHHTGKPPLLRSMSAQIRREPVESISEFQEQNSKCPHICELPLGDKDFQKLVIEEEDFVLPRNWPSEQEHAQSLDFKIRKSRSSSTSLCEESSKVYPMTRRPRGRLVIINNFQFDGEVDAERMARSQQDATSLDVLFKQLHFETKHHSNLTLKDLSSLLEEERTRDHTSIDCYVMVFMSRGDGEQIYGIDGYRIEVDTIISMFDFEHCSSLRRKPKIFIFQACDDVAAKSKLLGEEKNNYDILAPLEPSSSTSPESMRTDMFVVNAVQDVAVSYHGVFGSRFIQSFVYLMRNLAFIKDFEEIVGKINQLNSVSEPEIIKFANSFSRRLFFNP